MPEPISKKELELIEKRGGQIDTLAKVIAVPALENIARHFDEMKHEEMASYKAASESKLAKMDELIKVIQEAASGSDAEVKAMLVRIMTEHSAVLREHATLTEQFNAHKEHCEKHEGDELCAYRLTGQRDRRGFIDIEFGITFTPVKHDE